jgi:hypothetical protein
MGQHRLDNKDDPAWLGESPWAELDLVDRPSPPWPGRVLVAIISAVLVGIVVLMIASSMSAYRSGERARPPGTRVTAGPSGTVTSPAPSTADIGTRTSSYPAPSATPAPPPAPTPPPARAAPAPTARPSPVRTVASRTTSVPVTTPALVRRIGVVLGIGGACMDLDGGVSFNGNRVQIWPCNGTVAQTVTAGTDGTLRLVDLCLRGLGGAMTAGTRLEAWTCDGQSAQQWRFVDGRIVNPGTGLCVDTEDRGSSAGTPLVVAVCDGGATQRWTPPPPA